MDALHALYDLVEQPDLGERKKLLAAWVDEWVAEVEAMKLVPKDRLEAGKLESDIAIAQTADELKTSILTAVGNHQNMLFFHARPVDGGVEFMLRLALLLRRVPRPAAPAQTALHLV